MVVALKSSATAAMNDLNDMSQSPVVVPCSTSGDNFRSGHGEIALCLPVIEPA
jgi:hypothetical protein